ncbi:MAG: hypothetical protein IT318_08365 [Anaerolineales bacterium]|nr:hypothetical protein [Anaerolineales bacterium]
MSTWSDEIYRQALIQLDEARQSELKQLESKFRELHGAITSSYHDAISLLERRRDQVAGGFDLSQVEWDHAKWDTYVPNMHGDLPNQLRVGTLRFHGWYSDFDIPALLTIGGARRNVVLKAGTSQLDTARTTLQSLVMRLLALAPVRKVRLIAFDPIGLGDTIAGLVQDLPELLVQGRAWTETSQIEEQLGTLEASVAQFKQKSLGKKYASIEEYNLNAGELEEPYRIVVISDFPHRFSDIAAQRLLNIGKHSASVGVYLFMMVNSDRPVPDGFVLAEFEATAHVISLTSEWIRWEADLYRECELIPDQPPSIDLYKHLVTLISECSSSLLRRMAPFTLPGRDIWWRANAGQEIRVPIGKRGPASVQDFVLREEEHYAALIVGRSGYGKSNLLQVIVDTICVTYSPDEVELYLIDFKQVTFQVYARYKIPHAPIIAVNADREFAVSVLRKLDQEVTARAELFSQHDEEKLSEYRRATGHMVPRVVLIVDECQELFHDDSLGREADLIIERIVRLGRALGVHVVLSSQSLRGSTSMSSVTKDLIPIRIALQCSDADARFVMSDDNNEATLLERPGQAIYNTSNGFQDGNRRFHVYWIEKEQRRRILGDIQASSTGTPPISRVQIIFDGRAQGAISGNTKLQEWLIRSAPDRREDTLTGWLGEPIEIRPHTRAEFRFAEGSNLVILGGSSYLESVHSIVVSCFASIAAQSTETRFVFADFSGWERGPEYLSRIQGVRPEHVEVVSGQREVETLLKSLDREVLRRQKSTESAKNHTTTFLILIGLQSIGRLRKSDDLVADTHKRTIGDILLELCVVGPKHGLLTIAWCDLLRNLERALGGDALDAFDMRVALQMPMEDSRLLFESDAASVLGPYRAIYHDYNRNHTEKFRPYALEDVIGVIEQLAQARKARIV